VRTVDVEKFTSWREGRVFFEDLPLGDAVAEMNRYSAIQIEVDDSALSHLRVNGMFRAGEQEAFVTALQDYFPISVTRRGDAKIILAPVRSNTPRTL
jgi:transmembrane sensor